MIEPYSAIALSPRTIASEQRSDYMRNVNHITEVMDMAFNIAATQGPAPKLFVIPEWTIQGPFLKFRGGDRKRQEELAIEVPGPEIEALAAKAKQLKAFIAGELYLVRDDDFPDRFFNIAFIVDPSGSLIYRRAKLQVEPFEPEVMGTTCPHDVWDKWMEVKGDGNALDALYPVVDTEIGKIGVMICMEGGYPEIARGLAMNGAEVIVRMTYHDPYVSNGWWELQNRSHAMFNNAYVVAPNLGPQHFGPEAYPIDVGGGKSMIVDFRGEILVQREFVAADSFVSELLDIEALRRYRASNGFGKWLKDLRTEQYAVIYEQPIYPKNQYLDVAPTVGWHEREVAILDRNIEELRRRGALVAPSGISASADELEPAVR